MSGTICPGRSVRSSGEREALHGQLTHLRVGIVQQWQQSGNGIGPDAAGLFDQIPVLALDLFDNLT